MTFVRSGDPPIFVVDLLCMAMKFASTSKTKSRLQGFDQTLLFSFFLIFCCEIPTNQPTNNGSSWWRPGSDADFAACAAALPARAHPARARRLAPAGGSHRGNDGAVLSAAASSSIFFFLLRTCQGDCDAFGSGFQLRLDLFAGMVCFCCFLRGVIG
jgi:hypothetical protein